MWRDDANLLDMLIWARRGRDYVSGVTLQEFLGSTLAQDATIRCLQVIGEAAGRVSAEFRDAHAEIPWSRITGMRNRLVHEYGHVDLAEVWRTASRDCAELASQLEPLVPPAGATMLPGEWEFL